MIDGEIVMRGTETFESNVHGAVEALETAGRVTARDSCENCSILPQSSTNNSLRINSKSAKSFGSHSYEKSTRKSFRIYSYKIIGLKVPSNHTLTRGVRCSL